MRKYTPKIFIATPHADRKNYCLEQYFDVLNNLTYSNTKIMVADNSETNDNVLMFRKEGLEAVHIKPKRKSNIQYICESHNALRTAFLRSDCDIFFHLESDIIPPPDIIERLLMWRKRVVGAPYFISQGGESHLITQEMEDWWLDIRLTKRMDDTSDFMFVDGELKKVHTLGLGCIMIDRDTLDKVPFRWEPEIDAHPDSFFAHDLHALDIPIYCDTSIICGHNNVSWSEFRKASYEN